MKWRDWLVACSLAGVVGVGVGALQAGLTGSDRPAGRSSSSSTSSTAEGLPPPQEQGRAAVTTRPSARTVTMGVTEVMPSPKKPKPSKGDRGDSGQGGGGHKGKLGDGRRGGDKG
ncbi:MAG TPA: hypothetical protein VEL73_04730 [Mycobacteriales bacterium]|nr:hypothetical protein [Mycobacteriales bacterium]